MTDSSAAAKAASEALALERPARQAPPIEPGAAPGASANKDIAMKAYLTCVAGTVSIVALMLWSGAPRAESPGNSSAREVLAQASREPFAVVELFTSEGCYSCPPADQALADIAARARAENLRVFPIAFHVDYWNYIGWDDPFSDAEYSRRQGLYARHAFNTNRRYTPQMIVNGTEEFVGSKRGLARENVNKALQKPARAGVSLSGGGPAASGALAVSAKVEGGFKPGDRLCAVLVERGIEQEVPRGENAGRVLRHENVARAFEVKVLDASGSARFELAPPADMDRSKATFFVFVQDQATWEIFGAAALDAKP